MAELLMSILWPDGKVDLNRQHKSILVHCGVSSNEDQQDLMEMIINEYVEWHWYSSL